MVFLAGDDRAGAGAASLPIQPISVAMNRIGHGRYWLVDRRSHDALLIHNKLEPTLIIQWQQPNSPFKMA